MDLCAEIASASFRSVKDFEIGLGPDGPALGKRNITVQGTNLVLEFNDTGFTAPFTCSDGIIAARFRDQVIQGRYDPATRRLTLAGVEYERVN
jgi:hypothetical protein